ncbi:MAG: adenylate/guanylate cyclase domain-containing protein [Planctomycetota bacterium]
MLALTVKNDLFHQQQAFVASTIRLTGDPDAGRRWQIERCESREPELTMLETADEAGCDGQVADFGQDESTISIRVPGQTPEELDLTIRQIGLEDLFSIEMTNRGRSVALSSGPRIHRGRKVELTLPLNFCIGQTQFQLVDQNASHPTDDGLTTISQKLLTDRECQVSPGPETLAAWLETLSDLQRMAAGTQPLFDLATQAVFNPGGLDGCMLLQRVEGQWRIIGSHLPYPDNGIGFREDLVVAAFESGETLYHDAMVIDKREQLDDLHTAVVCPVIDAEDQASAVVYGFRSLHRRNLRKGIRFLEAQFVQVVADSLSAGMIRLNSEAEAARSQVLLQQAFAPKIARQLQYGTEVLQPRTQEVTVLFADLRGFSSIAEQSGVDTTFRLLANVMDQFSNAITDLDGVIIDFYGDGISAFWNAPVIQPEHAVLACQAAIEIIDCIPELNRSWAAAIGRPVQVGVGIHTGSAMVGNSGSRSRLKYGPRGMTVNVASRLESLTKELQVPLLISGTTAERIQGVFETKKLQSVPLKGHESAIDLYCFPKLNERSSEHSSSVPVPENRTQHHSTHRPFTSEKTKN